MSRPLIATIRIPSTEQTPLLQLLDQMAMMLVCLLPFLLGLHRTLADVTVSIIALLFLAGTIIKKDHSWLSVTYIRLLLCFWLFICITQAVMGVFGSSFFTALGYIRFILFFVALEQWLLTTPDRVKMINIASLSAILLFAVDAYVQYLTGTSLTGKPVFGGNRLTGPLSAPIIGSMITKIFPCVVTVVAYMTLKGKNKSKGLPLLLAVLGLVAIVLLTGERAASTLMLTSVSIIIVLCVVFLPPYRRLILLGGSVMAGLILILYTTQPVVQQRAAFMLEQLEHFKESPYGKLYQTAFALWQQHPIAGIGVKGFRDLCKTTMDTTSLIECTNLHPHNLYLETLVSSGIIGFLLMLGALITILIRTLKTTSFSGAACIVAAGSIGGFFVLLFPHPSQSFFSNWPAMLFWFSLALAATSPRVVEKNS